MTVNRDPLLLHEQFTLAAAGHCEPLALAVIRAHVPGTLARLSENGEEEPATGRDAETLAEFEIWSSLGTADRVCAVAAHAALYLIEGLAAFRRTSTGEVDVTALRAWLAVHEDAARARRRSGASEPGAAGVEQLCRTLTASLPEQVSRQEFFDRAGQRRDAAAGELVVLVDDASFEAYQVAACACERAAEMLARAFSAAPEPLNRYLDHRAEWMTMVGTSFMERDGAA